MASKTEHILDRGYRRSDIYRRPPSHLDCIRFTFHVLPRSMYSLYVRNMTIKLSYETHPLLYHVFASSDPSRSCCRDNTSRSSQLRFS